MNQKRVRILKYATLRPNPVVYWMSRDQRADDNWALLFAQKLAVENKQPLIVVFNLVEKFLDATIRQYAFMLKGLRQTAEALKKKNIPFFLLTGTPHKWMPKFIVKYKAGALVTDFDPLKIKQHWKKRVAKQINVCFYEVDTHNIVPCWLAAPNQQYAARTLRPKLLKLLPEFLDKFEELKKHPFPYKGSVPKINWQQVTQKLKIDTSVPEVDWLIPGEKTAQKMLSDFIRFKLADYPDKRNDPTQDGQSNLSPYLHFGQFAPQRAALEVQKSNAPQKAKEVFLEELIIRRELSDNFCFYNKNYDNPKCFPNWARITLKMHRKDKREYLYALKDFEQANTHDPLWNAAQMEMLTRGKMHGFMRMYWCKKILEWTRSPAEAMKIAIYLNDKYELDGRNPNGYAGIAWSIGGIHDRPWPQRKIFGTIRYMSYDGCKNKFDVERYIAKYLPRKK
jgi:deoxyribodipyrimidine photo-lyase